MSHADIRIKTEDVIDMARICRVLEIFLIPVMVMCSVEKEAGLTGELNLWCTFYLLNIRGVFTTVKMNVLRLHIRIWINFKKMHWN